MRQNSEIEWDQEREIMRLSEIKRDKIERFRNIKKYWEIYGDILREKEILRDMKTGFKNI